MGFLKNTLTNLDIHLGAKCNLRCLHCNYWLEKNPIELPNEVLWRKVQEAIAYVESDCLNFDKVLIIGGEPFVHLGLAEFLYEQRFNTYLTIYTSFSILLPEYNWPSNVHFITSLDAPDDQTYRQKRRTKDFPITMENLRRNRKWLIHVDTTVSKLNIDKLDRILEITEGLGCTHWFFPVDPRMLRYEQDHRGESLVKATANRLRKILLETKDLKKVRDFYHRHHDTPYINDYEMFEGIYLAGLKHFEDLPEYGGNASLDEISLNVTDHCPARERYLQIGFDNSGKYIPIIHCPELKEIYPTNPTHWINREFSGPLDENVQKTVPHFDHFPDLVDWVSDAYDQIKCNRFCGKVQFLGIDEYKDLFSKVKITRINSLDVMDS